MSKILSALVIFLLMQSCSKINDVTTEPVIKEKIGLTSKSPQEQVRYAERNLRELGTEIAKLARDKDFKDFIHNEVKKKFDDEYELLVQDIFKNNYWKSKANYGKVEQSLNALKNIDGINLYPQIYIPRFQFLEDNGGSQTTSSLNEDEPSDSVVYIYYAGDAEVDSATNEHESYPGYVLNEEGQMEYWGMVNEEYANNNEVWVISTNESVTNEGYVCPLVEHNGVNFQECPGGGGGGNDNPPPPPPSGCNGDPNCDPQEQAPFTEHFPDLGHSKVNCKIEFMIVKDGKESWVAGASEIHIRAKMHTHNNRVLGEYAPAQEIHYRSLQYSGFIGKRIAKFRRKQIRDGEQKYVSYALETNWQGQFSYNDPIFTDYVIFEKDNFPAGRPENVRSGRNDTRIGNSAFTSNWDQKYRSSGKNKPGDTRSWPYDVNSATNSFQFRNYALYFNDAFVNNNVIAYNLVGY